jgi:hypothetical protein
MKRSTVVAFVVLVVLIGLVYWLERDDAPSADVDRVFDVSEDAIERVEILSSEGEPVVVERDGERFRLVAPVAADTDPREVDLVLSNLATMTAVRSFAPEAGADMAEFGLDAPALEVRFVTGDGTERAIRFGKDTLTASNQYAAGSGSDDVLVVGNHFARNLGKSAWELRDKAIFHLVGDAEPERVIITRGDEIIELASEDGVWVSAGPPRVRVDRFEVTGMVARFRRAEMLRLADDASIETPSLRLDVRFAGDTGAMTLEIGEQQHVDYLARVPSRDRVFLIEAGLVRELQRDVTEWWSKKLLHHATTETTATRIATPDGERTLNREDAQGLLRALSSATAEAIVTNVPEGEPDYLITVTTDGAEDAIAFHAGEAAAYAVRRDEDVALKLPAESWQAIQTELALEKS